MSGPGGLVWGGVPDRGGSASVPSGIPPPPLVNRMTDRCKNITLATTSLRPVKINREHKFAMCRQNTELLRDNTPSKQERIVTVCAVLIQLS